MVNLFLYWEKVTILSLKSKLFGKFSAFQCYWWKYQNAKKQFKYKKFQLKWEILKDFTMPKQQQASLRKSFSLPPGKSWTKVSLRRYAGIYRHLLPKCFENAVHGRVEMMQWKCFFLTPSRLVLRFPARKSDMKRCTSNMRFWINCFLVQIFFFGTVLRCFSQRNFEIFSSSVNHGGWHFTQTGVQITCFLSRCKIFTNET